MPNPQCIKTYYQTTMMHKVPQSMGFYYGQTNSCTARALHAHCAEGAPRCIVWWNSFGLFESKIDPKPKRSYTHTINTYPWRKEGNAQN